MRMVIELDGGLVQNVYFTEQSDPVIRCFVVDRDVEGAEHRDLSRVGRGPSRGSYVAIHEEGLLPWIDLDIGIAALVEKATAPAALEPVAGSALPGAGL